MFANQIIGQVDDKGEAIITFGQATPPVLLGTPEEQREQAGNIQFVQVRPVAGFELVRARLEELATVIRRPWRIRRRCRECGLRGTPHER